jgi:hypothetical protein
LFFKFCVSSDVLLNAIGTAGAASSEAKKTLPSVGFIDIKSVSIDEVNHAWLDQDLSEKTLARLPPIAALPMLATGSTENAANAGHVAFAGVTAHSLLGNREFLP